MTRFDTETCGRCGGSGKYSYNQMDGDRCYGCSGTGVAMTKRGKAASAFFRSLLETPASQIQVGHSVLTGTGPLGMGPDRWHVVSEIDGSRITLKRNGKTHAMMGFAVLRSVRDEAHRQELLTKALAYQATLTKAGKPAARVAEEVAA